MPVKEEEIRIGNWFREIDGFWSYRKDDIMKWKPNFQWKSSDWYALGECRIDLDFIEPIPISSDILEASDFKKVEVITKDEWNPEGRSVTTYSKEYSDLKVLNIRIQKSSNGIYFVCENIREYVYAVHELQNIYHVLYHSELEIKFP